MPALGEEWGGGENGFTPCSRFDCSAGGTLTVASRWGDPPAADVAGRDECACCASASIRDLITGVCEATKPAPAGAIRQGMPAALVVGLIALVAFA